MNYYSQPSLKYKRIKYNQKRCDISTDCNKIKESTAFDSSNEQELSDDDNIFDSSSSDHDSCATISAFARSSQDIAQALLLPYICDISFCPLKQPVLVKIDCNQLRIAGFNLPFNQYKDVSKNLFRFEIKGNQLYGMLISIADSSKKLKDRLIKNIETIPGLNNLKKMVDLRDLGILDLVHCPLKTRDELPQQVTLSEKLISRLFKPRDSIPHEVGEFEDSRKLESSCTAEKHQKSSVESRIESKAKPLNDSSSLGKDAIKRPDAKSKRVTELKLKIDQLDSKKAFLSEFDTTASIIRSLIDISREMLELQLDEKIELENCLNRFICEPDPTYKITASNRIFVEGCLPFELNQYEMAVKKARFKDPGSITYQLIKFAFPESYCSNVTLGKRAMSLHDYEAKRKQEKKPLAYILGFENPLDKPFVGISNLELGETRIRALLDHIFRIAGRTEYSNTEELKVRSRIVKELCRKNREFPKKLDAQESHGANRILRKDDNDIFAWDSDCF